MLKVPWTHSTGKDVTPWSTPQGVIAAHAALVSMDPVDWSPAQSDAPAAIAGHSAPKRLPLWPPSLSWPPLCQFSVHRLALESSLVLEEGLCLSYFFYCWKRHCDQGKL